ncbi:MAG: glycine zipper 2TM domain-containing protein [Magnetococcales bacterium]|nr:glycine zipper 2TM domain-containing protein [Magnetococcales bacterium]
MFHHSNGCYNRVGSKLLALVLAVGIGASSSSVWAGDDALAYGGVGAVVGAVTGGLLSSDHYRASGALLGAGLGGLAGYAIGSEQEHGRSHSRRYDYDDRHRHRDWYSHSRRHNHHHHDYSPAPVVIRRVQPNYVLVPMTPDSDVYYYRSYR